MFSYEVLTTRFLNRFLTLNSYPILFGGIWSKLPIRFLASPMADSIMYRTLLCCF